MDVADESIAETPPSAPAPTAAGRARTATPAQVPSVLRRVWGWSALGPARLAAALPTGATVDEDAFSSGEGGAWVWYPAAGSLRPRPLPRWWRFAGAGAGTVGTVTCRNGRARFTPNRFWARRGVPEWEREIVDQTIVGRWSLITTANGTAVLRHRRGAGRADGVVVDPTRVGQGGDPSR